MPISPNSNKNKQGKLAKAKPKDNICFTVRWQRYPHEHQNNMSGGAQPPVTTCMLSDALGFPPPSPPGCS